VLTMDFRPVSEVRLRLTLSPIRRSMLSNASSDQTVLRKISSIAIARAVLLDVWTVTVEGPTSTTWLHLWMETDTTCGVHGTEVTVPD
jgi:hypothetical protein